MTIPEGQKLASGKSMLCSSLYQFCMIGQATSVCAFHVLFLSHQSASIAREDVTIGVPQIAYVLIFRVFTQLFQSQWKHVRSRGVKFFSIYALWTLWWHWPVWHSWVEFHVESLGKFQIRCYFLCKYTFGSFDLAFLNLFEFCLYPQQNPKHDFSTHHNRLHTLFFLWILLHEDITCVNT